MTVINQTEHGFRIPDLANSRYDCGAFEKHVQCLDQYCEVADTSNLTSRGSDLAVKVICIEPLFLQSSVIRANATS